MKTGALLYEDKAKYDSWLKYLLGGILALTLVPGIIYISRDTETTLAMFGITLFDALLFYVILPKHFQVFNNSLKIILGGSFALTIPLADIRDARPVTGNNAFIYWVIRFATSAHNVVEIERKTGLSVVISPENSDLFLTELNLTRGSYYKHTEQ